MADWPYRFLGGGPAAGRILTERPRLIETGGTGGGDEGTKGRTDGPAEAVRWILWASLSRFDRSPAIPINEAAGGATTRAAAAELVNASWTSGTDATDSDSSRVHFLDTGPACVNRLGGGKGGAAVDFNFLDTEPVRADRLAGGDGEVFLGGSPTPNFFGAVLIRWPRPPPVGTSTMSIASPFGGAVMPPWMVTA